MSRVVTFSAFGGPEQLQIDRRSAPTPRVGQARVRVTAVGLNPLDWMVLSDAVVAAMFGISTPSGFGHDFAGVIDDVGAVGDRVFGSVRSAAAADHLVIDASSTVFRTPPTVSNITASTLTIAGLTAAAALSAADITDGDTVLIGGAAGGVGVFAVQLARLAGARVIGTAASNTAPFLRALGAEPVEYGAGLVDRVQRLGARVTAALDLYGTDTTQAALTLGVRPNRIATVAARTLLSVGVHRTGAANAPAHAMAHLLDVVQRGRLTVPIAATMPLDRIADAVTVQAAGHVHGKFVVTL